jgi:TolB protein
MKAKILKLGILLILMFSNGHSQRRLSLEIYGPGRELYRMAIPKPLGPSDISREVMEVMARDLMLSGFFKILDPRSFIVDLKKEGLGIDPLAWRAVGAQGVIKAQIILYGKEARFEFRLFEVARGGRVVFSRIYSANRAAVRKVVHMWCNEVLRYFTGISGVFGSKLLFARRTGHKRKDIFILEFGGHSAYQVTSNGSYNILPAWGPGGRIFFTSFIEGRGLLYLKGKKKAVARYPGLNMGASISPNKREMAITLTKDGNAEIYILDLKGRIKRRLTRHWGIDVSAAWSPSGNKIAFVSDRQGSPQIYIMNRDGTGIKRLTFRGTYNQMPVWCRGRESPFVVFAGRDKGIFDIFTVDIKTREIIRLTQNQGSNIYPACSPDGRLIAFYSTRGGIFVMRSDGTNQTLILKGHAQNIRWSSYVPGF